MLAVKSRKRAAAIQLAGRSAIAAAVAVAIVQWLGTTHPIYAMIAAVIVTDLRPEQSRQFARNRFAGTVIGAGLGAAAVPWLGPSALAVLLTVSTMMMLCHALKLDGAAKVSGYVCGIVVLEHSGNAWHYAGERLVETLVGIGVALALSLVPKLIRVDEGGAGPG